MVLGAEEDAVTLIRRPITEAAHLAEVYRIPILLYLHFLIYQLVILGMIGLVLHQFELVLKFSGVASINFRLAMRIAPYHFKN